MRSPGVEPETVWLQLRPCLLWLGTDWKMRTMPRGSYYPVVNPEIRHMEEKLYASPEELLGRAPTCASDIYSLGVLCVELFHAYATPEDRPKVQYH
jgi:hypothetical protein